MKTTLILLLLVVGCGGSSGSVKEEKRNNAPRIRQPKKARIQPQRAGDMIAKRRLRLENLDLKKIGRDTRATIRIRNVSSRSLVGSVRLRYFHEDGREYRTSRSMLWKSLRLRANETMLLEEGFPSDKIVSVAVEFSKNG